ncbi:MAG: hypothetical protein J6Y85_03580 [Alphaproteobacteria bacterium]|nr:hypothetical protein [Alphaproteobacteria bacterium]
MEKILKWLHFLFSFVVDTFLIFGVLVVALYFIWGITPQTIVEKSSYFFSESWKIISGQDKSAQPIPVVTQKQVDEAQEHIHYK